MIANFWHGHELAEALPMTHAVAVVISAFLVGLLQAEHAELGVNVALAWMIMNE